MKLTVYFNNKNALPYDNNNDISINSNKYNSNGYRITFKKKMFF